MSNDLYVGQGVTVIGDADVFSMPDLDGVDDLLRELWVYYCKGNLCNFEDMMTLQEKLVLATKLFGR